MLRSPFLITLLSGLIETDMEVALLFMYVANNIVQVVRVHAKLFV